MTVPTFPRSPVVISQGSSAPTGIATDATNAGGLQEGDTCVIAVISANDQLCGPPKFTGTTDDAGFATVADVDGTGTTRVKAFVKTLGPEDFLIFGPTTSFRGYTFSDWSAVATNHIIVAFLRHADGPLTLHNSESYTNNTAGTGDYTVATLADLPRAGIAFSFVRGTPGTLTFAWDGGAAAAPQWDESVTGNNNAQGGYKLYDDSDTGVSLVYNAGGNNNKAVLTFTLVAAPPPAASGIGVGDTVGDAFAVPKITVRARGVGDTVADAFGRQPTRNYASGRGDTVADAYGQPATIVRARGLGDTVGDAYGRLVEHTALTGTGVGDTVGWAYGIPVVRIAAGGRGDTVADARGLHSSAKVGRGRGDTVADASATPKVTIRATGIGDNVAEAEGRGIWSPRQTANIRHVTLKVGRPRVRNLWVGEPE